MPMARRIRPIIAAALLLIPALGIAAERVGKAMAGDIELSMPIPERYVQASLDMPELLEELRHIAIPGLPRPVDVLVAPECTSEQPEAGLYCLTSYEIFVSQSPFDSRRWPDMRSQLMTMLERESEGMLRTASEVRAERNKELGLGVALTIDAESPVIVLAPKDTRSVRFRLRTPLEADVEGERVRQWRFGGQFVLHGKLFNVMVVRNLPAGSDDEAIAKEMEAQLDAFARQLYALNPMHAEP